MIIKKSIFLVLILFAISLSYGYAQLSPGKLTTAHEKLEGLTNCTACHELGEKVNNSKCLDCHKEIKKLIDAKDGYHASAEVTGKECIVCHSEHHGRNFQIVHFDTLKFKHDLTGYELKGKHATITCSECHKAENIKTKISQKNGKTFLGLDTKCLSCHTDYHQKTLSADCKSCHGFESFKPAPGFKHQTTKFPLRGKHSNVTCEKCHPVITQNSVKFQRFAGIEFSGCISCHKDVHENKFGSDCRKCHTENSFHQLSGTTKFDHSKTNFTLIGKHQELDCKKCHKSSYTTPIKHDRCIDCHADYHKGQFMAKNFVSDCKDCHDENDFRSSGYSIDRHNESKFKLQGAHAATPCFTCHKKTEEWKFSNLDTHCVSCHKNIHLNFISDKYIPEGKCETCHSVFSWEQVNFDHKATGFELKGKHKEKTCRDCHFKKNDNGTVEQRFNTLSGKCEDCHTDIHQKQFSVNGTTDCTLCHAFENWKAVRFNHDQTRFKLDGGHKGVECRKCHTEKTTGSITYIQYKNTQMQCSSCHLQLH